jgi:DNA-binding transcriptional ArsR family regulator
MTEQQTKLHGFIKILSDTSKYKILLLLSSGEVCVCKISEALGLEQTLVSHHIRTLKKTGLIKTRKIGKWVHCSVDSRSIEDLNTLYSAVFKSSDKKTSGEKNK